MPGISHTRRAVNGNATQHKTTINWTTIHWITVHCTVLHCSVLYPINYALCWLARRADKRSDFFKLTERCEVWHTKDVRCDTRKMWGVTHERCEVWHKRCWVLVNTYSCMEVPVGDTVVSSVKFTGCHGVSSLVECRVSGVKWHKYIFKCCGI